MTEILVLLPAVASFLVTIIILFRFLKLGKTAIGNKATQVFSTQVALGGLLVVTAVILVGANYIYYNSANDALRVVADSLQRLEGLLRVAEDNAKAGGVVSKYAREDLKHIGVLKDEIRALEGEITGEGIVWPGGGSTKRLEEQWRLISETMDELQALQVGSTILKRVADGKLQVGVIEVEGEGTEVYTEDNVEEFIEKTRNLMKSAPPEEAAYGTWTAPGECTGAPRDCFRATSLIIDDNGGSVPRVARIQAKFSTGVEDAMLAKALPLAVARVRSDGLGTRSICEIFSNAKKRLLREHDSRRLKDEKL